MAGGQRKVCQEIFSFQIIMFSFPYVASLALTINQAWEDMKYYVMLHWKFILT